MSNGAITHSVQTASLADILERVLDKGIVVAGDITISLADVELLNIKIRLLVASVDKAKEIGINWWQNDPSLSSASTTIQSPAPMRVFDVDFLSKERAYPMDKAKAELGFVPARSTVAKLTSMQATLVAPTVPSEASASPA